MKHKILAYFATMICVVAMTAQVHAVDLSQMVVAALAHYTSNGYDSPPKDKNGAAVGSGEHGTGKAFRTSGKVVHVDDGDTVVLLEGDHTQLKIRLSSIDAPESSHTKQERGRVGQPYSENSGKYLASLVKGKIVEATCFESDRYGRSVCELFVDGASVNQDMVRQGLAWANQASNGRYLRDKTLPSLETKARASRLGLWAGANPVPPWQWRDACWKQGQCSQ